MGFGDYLSSLVPWNKATETDSDAPPPGNDLGMHLLYDGTKARADQTLVEDNQPCLEPVDIVAVHGLEGHAIATWTHPDSRMMWLQTLLSVAMPMSRIMSYGYDAKIYKSRSTLHIKDNAADLLSEIQARRTSQTLQGRRIIFIGHSMGGIVIKKALIMAREENQHHGLLQSTIGVMFMGTPHNGAGGANLVSTVLKIAKSIVTLNNTQVEMLKRDSAQLQDISRSFGFLEDLKIVTVMESDETHIPGLGDTLIVPQTSAQLNLGNRETSFSVSKRDHCMVCKFSGEDDKQYHKIKIEIIKLAASPVSNSSDVTELHKRLHSIDESISQGSGKIRKTLNEGLLGTKGSLATLEVRSDTQYNNELRERMLRILSPLTNHAKKRLERTPKTGLAFLQTTEYRDWKTGRASFLWLYGKSGTGKTVLFSTIAEDISAYCASGITNSAVAPAYCSWSDQDVASLISTLLSEFISKMSKVPQESVDLIEKCRGSTYNEADLSEALHCILTHLDTAYIMIDGLDEWPLENSRRSSLLGWIARLDGYNLPHLHVLLTSQHLPDIKETLSDKCALRIDSRGDILIHVKHELTDQQLARFDCSLKTEIEEFLLVGSDEGFRWVALQLMELKSCILPKDIREALRKLPKTLKETYDKILDSVPERNQSYVRAALQWIACSARPLSLDELAVAAVIDPAVAKLDGSENQHIGGDTIYKMLSKLIDVHEVERLSLGDPLNQRSTSRSITDVMDDLERRRQNLKYPGRTIVKFSHSSVRDYLLQRHNDSYVSRSFSFSEDVAHRFIAKSCFAYIQNMPEIASVGNKAFGESWICLLMYLASHWHTHAARLPDEEPGSMAHLFNQEPLAVGFLLTAEDEYTNQSLGDILGFEEFPTKPLSPEQKLQYAACSGFSCVVDGILASNPDLDVNASTEHGGTALSFACERRHWKIADTLLKRGADPNQHDGMAVPLFNASMHGSDDIVQELISHGADVNVCEISYADTPLTAAIVARHLSTIELLLINGADPAIESNLGTSIAVAARYGRYECMDLLLKHGASLEVLDLDSPSLLEYASASGSVETVKLLLTQGLDVNEENCLLPLPVDGMSPASIYSLKYPYVGITQPKPYLNVFYESYGSPMHAAAAYGHTEVIKLLLENNAAVNERSHYWETPSTLARLRGRKVALEYLLSKGGVASEQTEVCYRQDLFKGSGDSYEDLKFCVIYDDDEDDDIEGDDGVSNDDDVMEE